MISLVLLKASVSVKYSTHDIDASISSYSYYGIQRPKIDTNDTHFGVFLDAVDGGERG